MVQSVRVQSLVVATVLMLAVGCAQRSPQVSAPTAPGVTGPTAEELRAREEAERRRRIAESQIATATGPTAPSPGASVLDPIYFEFDQASLTDQSRDVLVRNAEWLRANPQVRVQVEGHTDERGTTEYNLALGERRATSVRGYLTSLGIDADRLVTISYGKERPADTGHSEAAWAMNRRVEFKAM
jgi:peptidoglycan-associated lipoprotein